MERSRPRLFGVVLAGGRSRRFGSPKARARVAGRTLLDHALDILREAGLETGVIANRAADLPLPGDATLADPYADGELRNRAGKGPAAIPPTRPRDLPTGEEGTRATPFHTPVRPDVTPGAGPLGGLHAALCWARERGDAGVFLLGCDLPLVPPALVDRLAHRFDPARPTVPASPGPLGIEPLCGCYPAGLLPAVEGRLEAGRFGMGKFVHAYDPVVVSLDQLASGAGSEHVFLNVNTPADRERASRLLG